MGLPTAAGQFAIGCYGLISAHQGELAGASERASVRKEGFEHAAELLCARNCVLVGGLCQQAAGNESTIHSEKLKTTESFIDDAEV